MASLLTIFGSRLKVLIRSPGGQEVSGQQMQPNDLVAIIRTVEASVLSSSHLR